MIYMLFGYLHAAVTRRVQRIPRNWRRVRRGRGRSSCVA